MDPRLHYSHYQYRAFCSWMDLFLCPDRVVEYTLGKNIFSYNNANSLSYPVFSRILHSSEDILSYKRKQKSNH